MLLLCVVTTHPGKGNGVAFAAGSLCGCMRVPVNAALQPSLCVMETGSCNARVVWTNVDAVDILFDQHFQAMAVRMTAVSKRCSIGINPWLSIRLFVCVMFVYCIANGSNSLTMVHNEAGKLAFKATSMK